MLQIITRTPAQVTAALAAGAAWIHHCDPSTLDAIIAPCREARAIVTIPGSADLQKETRIHGVILAPGDTPASKAREILGPHAVIGCRVTSLFEILSLAPLDVDFFVLDAPAEEIADIISMARSKGVEQRIAALSDDPAALTAGADALLTADFTLLNNI